MSYPEKRRSNAWFLLPIFFGIIGGIIAFFVLRQDDPNKAKSCLYLGIALMIVGIILNIFVAATFCPNDILLLFLIILVYEFVFNLGNLILWKFRDNLPQDA